MEKSELGVFAFTILALSLIFIVSSSVSFVSATHNATHNSTNQTASCVDSDGGLNYYVFGRVTQNGSNGSTVTNDVCSGSAIVEAYCSGVNTRVEWWSCPYGCANGACLSNPGGNSTNQTHRACVNNTCALVNGSGSNQCSTLGASCGNQTAICGNGVVESGEVCDPPGSSISCTSQGVAGTRTCNAQCTSYGSCIIPYHNECREVNGTKSCVPIPGNGTVQCRNDAGCQTGPLKGGNTGRGSSTSVQYSPPSALFAKLMCFFSSKC
ncbi:MAG: hypothetical protein AABW79_04470 [Nanoarchaeota archaeon]